MRREVALPEHEELLRQLGNVVASATPSGHVSIGTRTEATHDDLADALTLAVAALPARLPPVEPAYSPDSWVHTPAGVGVPVPLLVESLGHPGAGVIRDLRGTGR